jgi:peptidoglycan/xylan/chitin deacetylase (PgdA/CDA1 family)
MESSGLIEICNHGKQHTDYTKVPLDDLVLEITGAHRDIQDNLGGNRLKLFAYPYGKASKATKKQLLEHGFEVQVLTGHGRSFQTRKSDLTEINRIKCWNGLSGKEILKIVEKDKNE